MRGIDEIEMRASVDESIIVISPGVELPEGVGGKALGLQRIMEAGLRVPDAWVVLPGAEDEELLKFAARLKAQGVRSLAVRSSAQEEDAQQFSFAGIHETRLGVPPESLSEAIKEVSASSTTESAESYRRAIGLPQAPGGCAVVVQLMVKAEKAGIAFGVGDGNDQVVIEAVEGLGDLAVQGTVTPERLKLRRLKGKWNLETRQARWQPEALLINDVAPERVAIPGDRWGSDVLDDVTAHRMAEGVAFLQKRFGGRLDVEWAAADSELYFLQARPQTCSIDADLPKGRFWTRMNLREVLPDIPSATMRSALLLSLDAGLRDFIRMHGIKVSDDNSVVSVVYGRPVFNEDLVYLVGDSVGAPRELAQAYMGGLDSVKNEFIAINPFRALRHPVILLKSARVTSKAERLALEFVTEARGAAEKLSSVDFKELNDDFMLDEIQREKMQKFRQFGTHSMAVVSALGYHQYAAQSLLKRFPNPSSVLTRLLAAGERTVSTRQLDDLVSIAAAMRDWRGGREFLREIRDEHASARYWEESLPDDVWSMVSGWLSLYGHRGPYESDAASPRYSEDLRFLARLLSPLVNSVEEPETPENARKRCQDAAADAWAEVAARLGRLSRRRLRRSVLRVKRLMVLRELLRYESVKMGVAMRRMGLELGRRLHERGRLESVGDIWHLSLEEQLRAFRDNEFDAAMAVKREQSRIAAWRRIEVPNRFSTEEIPLMPHRGYDEVVSDKVLRGNGVSPGIAEGEVCILRSLEEGQRMKPGTILVTMATDPGWTPLFTRAVAIVTEIGGMLSHAGIVAREYGLPSVSNVGGITQILRTGDIVRIDGTQGRIEIVSRAAGGVTTSAQ